MNSPDLSHLSTLSDTTSITSPIGISDMPGEFNDDEYISASNFEGFDLSQSDTVQLEVLLDPVLIQNNELNYTTSSPAIATPTRPILGNNFHNLGNDTPCILNFSTPGPPTTDSDSDTINTESIDLDSTSQSQELSTMENKTGESELGHDSENAMDILKKIRIKNIN